MCYVTIPSPSLTISNQGLLLKVSSEYLTITSYLKMLRKLRDLDTILERLLVCVKYYSLKNNKTITFESKWTQVEYIMLIEISQIQKNKYRIFSLDGSS